MVVQVILFSTTSPWSLFLYNLIFFIPLSLSSFNILSSIPLKNYHSNGAKSIQHIPPSKPPSSIFLTQKGENFPTPAIKINCKNYPILTQFLLCFCFLGISGAEPNKAESAAMDVQEKRHSPQILRKR